MTKYLPFGGRYNISISIRVEMPWGFFSPKRAHFLRSSTFKGHEDQNCGSIIHGASKHGFWPGKQTLKRRIRAEVV